MSGAGRPSERRKAWRRAVSRPRWGNLRRLEPFSAKWGFDRGVPVDRRYIEDFLAGHATKIRGRVLEVADRGYTERFGADVELSHVLDIDPSNPLADVVADLADDGSLPDAAYDCFILTQTLQYVADLPAALRNAYRTLAPGGWLLVTVPAIEPVNARESDRWRLLPAGLAGLVERTLPQAIAECRGRGNLVSAMAVLQGLAVEELRPVLLAADDPRFPVLSCAAIHKPS